MAGQRRSQRIANARLFARQALSSSVEGLVTRTGDCTRIARVASLCLGDDPIARRVVGVVEDRQQDDGGWANLEETLWSTSAILTVAGEETRATCRAMDWMRRQRSDIGGWGRSLREPPNFVLTALAITLVPELAEPRDSLWLEHAWRSDLESEVRLTYKGSLFLMTQDPASPTPLALQTLDYLSGEQNDDGGYGPWKRHSIGSDAWSSGVCAVGLARFADLLPDAVLERLVEYLLSSQLSSGYWAYHYLDEGSAYALWGLMEAATLLSAS